MALPQPGDRYGKFQLVRLIGRGGMGLVFEATDTVLKRQVALKVVLPQFEAAEMFTARFEREATVLARIRSRHIVNIHEYGEHEGTAYLVTELFPDGDLKAWMDTHGPFTPLAALNLLDQVCAGLHDAHEQGVLHRDIKPNNILLWNRPEGLLAYLCDFGIAADGETGLTSTGAVLGSYSYMAPERHLDTGFDARSDIYSVGCLLYALITGRPPYQGTDFLVSNAHINGPVPQLDGSGPLIGGINRLLAWMTAKNPEERPESIRDARREIAHLINLAHDAETGPEIFTPISTAAQPAPPEPQPRVGEDEFTLVRRPTPTAVETSASDAPTPIAAEPLPPAVRASSRRAPAIATVVAAAVLVGGGVLVANLAAGEDGERSPEGPLASSTGTTSAAPDLPLDRIVGTVKVSGEPRAIALAADGKSAYVARFGSKAVAVLSTAPLRVRSSIPVGGRPTAVAVLDPNRLLVTLSDRDQVAVLNTSTRAVQRIAVGDQPAAVTISPDRKTAWIPNLLGNTVSVLDLTSLTVVREISVGTEPDDVAFSPDGATAYVPNFGSASITPIDTGSFRTGAPIRTGGGPVSVAVSPDGEKLFVTSFTTNRVEVVDLRTGKVTKRFTTFAPFTFAVSPTRRYLYVTTQLDSLDVIDLKTNRAIRKIPSAPTWAMALTADGQRAFVTNNKDNTVSVFAP